MATKKARGARRGTPAVARFRLVALRCLAWAVALSLVATALWLGTTRAWTTISDRPEFILDLSALSFGDSPSCTRSEVMAHELSEQLAVALGGASIFEKDLCDRVQRELRAYPWVLDVKSVSRLMPSKLLVEVVFREPATLAEFAGRTYMIDKDGYLLPDHFYRRPNVWMTASMPVIVNRKLTSPPPLAKKWGGPALSAGARLYVFLAKTGLFEELPIKTIDVTRVGVGGSEPDIVLLTQNGVTIKWGRSDSYAEIHGLTLPSWANPDLRKLEMLRSKLTDYPGLEGLESIDVRLSTKISFRPIQEP